MKFPLKEGVQGAGCPVFSGLPILQWRRIVAEFEIPQVKTVIWWIAVLGVGVRPEEPDLGNKEEKKVWNSGQSRVSCQIPPNA